MRGTNVNEEELIAFYAVHSETQTKEKFKISTTRLHAMLVRNNIEKHSRAENRKFTCLERYGDENYSNREKFSSTMKNFSEDRKQEIENKKKQTRADKCGSVEESYRIGIEKNKQGKLEKYGDANYNNREKCLKTKKERYGDSSYCNPDKIAQTKLSRYGNAYYTNVEKQKETNLERYGNECSLHSDIVQEKVRKTNLERYGTEQYFQSDDFKSKLTAEKKSEIKEKSRQTTNEKYGVDWTFQSEEVKQKIQETIREKYGVDYFCLSPSCRIGNSNSKPNLEFEKLLQENNIEYQREFSIGSKQYDFKIENILIEINPTPTHNSTFGVFGHNPTDKYYHMQKTKLAEDNDYRCICVWDWDNQNKIVSELLKHNNSLLYARNCTIDYVDEETAKKFIDLHHLQGYAKCSVRIGLFYNKELVSIMTFDKPRYNKNYQYELVRYCSSTPVVGGASKLFKRFVDDYKAESVISYCDKAKFSGKVYTDLNFIKANKTTEPSKHWYNMKTGKHITDNLLRQYGFDALLGNECGCFGHGTSNEELMKKFGFVEIFDCGQETFVWKKS